MNGAEAVEIFGKDRRNKCCNLRIRLVFMDLMMPVLDGFDATKQIIDILRAEQAIREPADCLRDVKLPA